MFSMPLFGMGGGIEKPRNRLWDRIGYQSNGERWVWRESRNRFADLWIGWIGQEIDGMEDQGRKSPGCSIEQDRISRCGVRLGGSGELVKGPSWRVGTSSVGVASVSFGVWKNSCYFLGTLSTCNMVKNVRSTLVRLLM